MEPFGIMLSGPVALAAMTTYCWWLQKTLQKSERENLRFVLRVPSVVLLFLLFAELTLLVTIGAVRSRDLLGSGFYIAHLGLVVLGAPALATVFIGQRKVTLLSCWYIAGPISAAFGVILVVLQYAVSEALYGIDGMGRTFP